ncbi:MAG TPA: chromate efflux transporter [Beijerinckiaceae bacterium]|jgi:chromate transporter
MDGSRTVAPDGGVPFAEAVRLWAKVGILSFGGAAGQIAMLHRFVVEERRWMDERAFLAALNFVTLLPGPEAQQLATYIGWRLHGAWGGLLAGALFVVPGALVMLALTLLYVAGGGSALVAGAFLGIKAAVLAIVAEALHRIGKRALKTPLLVALAVLSLVALLAFDLPFPVVIVAAGLFGAGVSLAAPERLGLADRNAPVTALPAGRGSGLVPVLASAALWALPVVVAALLLGPGHVLVEIGLFFSKLAVVTFGGAYAVLAYLADAAVEAKRWVLAGEMVDALGLAETTPGPTILVNQFVGTLAAMRAPAPFSAPVAAVLGALMTSWVTFAPSFLWIYLGGPHLERLTGDRRLAGALTGITAAVVGVIATLAFTFAINVLFADVGAWRLGPAMLPWPNLASLRLDAAGLAVFAALLLFVWHRGVVQTVALPALAGLLLAAARGWGGF